MAVRTEFPGEDDLDGANSRLGLEDTPACVDLDIAECAPARERDDQADTHHASRGPFIEVGGNKDLTDLWGESLARVSLIAGMKIGISN
jgi:hypothetical protein